MIQNPALARPLVKAAEDLFPGYFALVMATGIVSIAGHFEAVPVIPHVLLGVNWIAYAVLCLLTLIRLFRFPLKVFNDLSDHRRGAHFFTIVAGTAVLGAQTFTVLHARAVGVGLWYLSLGLWFLIMYAFFVGLTIGEHKPSLASGLGGAWLIAVVATQSVVVLPGDLGAAEAPSPEIQFLCLILFMTGCMLYLAIIPFIAYRLIFFPFSTRDFNPVYWINMGAASITVLAGSILVLRANTWPLLRAYAPFLKGLILFFWAAATWWIPFLVALMVWRYGVRRDRLGYEPGFWGMVFPLGMYAAANFELSRAEGLPFLGVISRIFMFIGLAVWVFTFAGLLLELAGSIKRSSPRSRRRNSRSGLPSG